MVVHVIYEGASGGRGYNIFDFVGTRYEPLQWTYGGSCGGADVTNPHSVL